MSLLAVILIVLLLAAIATFAPIDARFKNLLYVLAVGVVIVYVLLLVFGAVDVGWPHDRVIIHGR